LLLERERRSVFTTSFSFSAFYTYLHPLRDYSLHDVAEYSVQLEGKTIYGYRCMHGALFELYSVYEKKKRVD